MDIFRGFFFGRASFTNSHPPAPPPTPTPHSPVSATPCFPKKKLFEKLFNHQGYTRGEFISGGTSFHNPSPHTLRVRPRGGAPDEADQGARAPAHRRRGQPLGGGRCGTDALPSLPPSPSQPVAPRHRNTPPHEAKRVTHFS